MKKIKIIIILLLCMIPLTGCGNKAVINSGELKEKLEESNYIVVDNKDKLEDFPGESALIATKNEGYAIMILTFKDVDTAKRSFTQLCDTAKEDNATTTTANIGNYSEFKLESKKNYYYILRVENNILAAYGTIDKKEDIKKELKKIGY